MVRFQVSNFSLYNQYYFIKFSAGLCYGDVLLPNLWTLLQSLGPFCGQKVFIDLLAANPKATSPEFQLLILFADCMNHLLTILDDVEMYEKQKPFALGHFIVLSTVVNQFLFKALWSNLIVGKRNMPLNKSTGFSQITGFLK